MRSGLFCLGVSSHLFLLTFALLSPCYQLIPAQISPSPETISEYPFQALCYSCPKHFSLHEFTLVTHAVTCTVLPENKLRQHRKLESHLLCLAQCRQFIESNSINSVKWIPQAEQMTTSSVSSKHFRDYIKIYNPCFIQLHLCLFPFYTVSHLSLGAMS